MEEGDYEGATDAFNRTLAIANRFGDVGLEMRALAQSSTVDFWHLRWEDAVAKGLRVIELASRVEDPISQASARRWVAITLINMGEPNRANPHAAATLVIAKRTRDQYVLATALWFNELLFSYQGDWEAAKVFSEQGLLLSPSDNRMVSSRMLLEYQVGNVAEAREYMERFVEGIQLLPPPPNYDQAAVALKIPLVVQITGDMDLLQIAENAADMVLSASSATPLLSQLARWGLALIAILRGDVKSAREQYSSLILGHTRFVVVSGDRVLGLLSQTMGDSDQAATHFEGALAFCRKAGYRPELAWTCHDYAETLLQRQSPADQAKIMELLEEGISISTDLGMAPLLKNVISLKEREESSLVRGTGYPNGLTEREVEVLRLVAAGRTDREIAEELIIAVRTVTTHVSNILNKTDSANRTEAASYATRQGLA